MREIQHKPNVFYQAGAIFCEGCKRTVYGWVKYAKDPRYGVVIRAYDGWTFPFYRPGQLSADWRPRCQRCVTEMDLVALGEDVEEFIRDIEMAFNYFLHGHG